MSIAQRLLDFNSSRARLWKENAAFAAAVPPGALVLDAGAGTAPYRSLFRHTQYETADFEKVAKHYEASTYVCDLQRIPVPDQRFDFIVFNQTLEHLPEPRLVLCELFRVLKPGGRLICSAPLFYEEHEQPYDFYRYTQFGLAHLFTSAGFTIETLDWLEGYFGTVGYQLNCMARYLPWRPRDLDVGPVGYLLSPLLTIVKFCCAIASVAFHHLETRLQFTGRGYPKNFVLQAQKPPELNVQAHNGVIGAALAHPAMP